MKSQTLCIEIVQQRPSGIFIKMGFGLVHNYVALPYPNSQKLCAREVDIPIPLFTKKILREPNKKIKTKEETTDCCVFSTLNYTIFGVQYT